MSTEGWSWSVEDGMEEVVALMDSNRETSGLKRRDGGWTNQFIMLWSSHAYGDKNLDGALLTIQDLQEQSLVSSNSCYISVVQVNLAVVDVVKH